jgi:hypothetical protein
MLTAKMNMKAGQSAIVASGSLEEITNDVANLINGLYSRMALSDHPEGAEVFRDVLTGLVNFPDTPLFQINRNHTGMSYITQKEK